MHRSVVAASFFVLALLAPRISGAQIYPSPTPVPQTTAFAADWQRGGQPLFLAGAYYHPSGPTVYFDGDAMRPVGVFRGVLLYEDPTAEPGRRVYVPVGYKLMRPYERRWEWQELAAASWMPGLALQRPYAHYDEPGGPEYWHSMRVRNQAGVVPDHPLVDARGEDDRSLSEVARPIADVGPTGVESIPAPRSSDGVWIVFEGDRWYSNGVAVRFDVDRFTPAGNYRGFPVYRDNRSASDRIFVTVVPDGPVAPYARR